MQNLVSVSHTVCVHVGGPKIFWTLGPRPLGIGMSGPVDTCPKVKRYEMLRNALYKSTTSLLLLLLKSSIWRSQKGLRVPPFFQGHSSHGSIGYLWFSVDDSR